MDSETQSSGCILCIHTLIHMSIIIIIIIIIANPIGFSVLRTQKLLLTYPSLFRQLFLIISY
jgi:hypothetical protein